MEGFHCTVLEVKYACSLAKPDSHPLFVRESGFMKLESDAYRGLWKDRSDEEEEEPDLPLGNMRGGQDCKKEEGMKGEREVKFYPIAKAKG